VVLGVAHGHSNDEIAARLSLSPVRAAQTLQAALTKLEDTYQPRRGLTEKDASEILRLMSRRKGGAPPTPVFDDRGRQVGAKAKAFGMCPEDLVGQPWGSTQTLVELAARITGQQVPFLRLRTRPNTSQCGAAVAAEWRRHREAVVDSRSRSRKKAAKLARRRSQSPA
jgi:hypothetical protein